MKLITRKAIRRIRLVCSISLDELYAHVAQVCKLTEGNFVIGYKNEDGELHYILFEPDVRAALSTPSAGTLLLEIDDHLKPANLRKEISQASANPSPSTTSASSVQISASPPKPTQNTPPVASSRTPSSSAPSSPSVAAQSWMCPRCTFANHILIPKCEMCETSKPIPIGSKRSPLVTSIFTSNHSPLMSPMLLSASPLLFPSSSASTSTVSQPASTQQQLEFQPAVDSLEDFALSASSASSEDPKRALTLADRVPSSLPRNSSLLSLQSQDQKQQPPLTEEQPQPQTQSEKSTESKQQAKLTSSFSEEEEDACSPEKWGWDSPVKFRLPSTEVCRLTSVTSTTSAHTSTTTSTSATSSSSSISSASTSSVSSASSAATSTSTTASTSATASSVPAASSTPRSSSSSSDSALIEPVEQANAVSSPVASQNSVATDSAEPSENEQDAPQEDVPQEVKQAQEEAQRARAEAELAREEAERLREEMQRVKEAMMTKEAELALVREEEEKRKREEQEREEKRKQEEQEREKRRKQEEEEKRKQEAEKKKMEEEREQREAQEREENRKREEQQKREEQEREEQRKREEQEREEKQKREEREREEKQKREEQEREEDQKREERERAAREEQIRIEEEAEARKQEEAAARLEAVANEEKAESDRRREEKEKTESEPEGEKETSEGASATSESGEHSPASDTQETKQLETSESSVMSDLIHDGALSLDSLDPFAHLSHRLGDATALAREAVKSPSVVADPRSDQVLGRLESLASVLQDTINELRGLSGTLNASVASIHASLTSSQLLPAARAARPRYRYHGSDSEDMEPEMKPRRSRRSSLSHNARSKLSFSPPINPVTPAVSTPTLAPLTEQPADLPPLAPPTASTTSASTISAAPAVVIPATDMKHDEDTAAAARPSLSISDVTTISLTPVSPVPELLTTTQALSTSSIAEMLQTATPAFPLTIPPSSTLDMAPTSPAYPVITPIDVPPPASMSLSGSLRRALALLDESPVGEALATEVAPSPVAEADESGLEDINLDDANVRAILGQSGGELSDAPKLTRASSEDSEEVDQITVDGWSMCGVREGAPRRIPRASAPDEAKLAQLRAMGYTNRSFNLVLLGNYGGDLAKVVAALQDYNK